MLTVCLVGCQFEETPLSNPDDVSACQLSLSISSVCFFYLSIFNLTFSLHFFLSDFFIPPFYSMVDICLFTLL